MKNTAFIFLVLFVDIRGSFAQVITKQKCEDVPCPMDQTCGLLRNCDGAGCSLEAVCLSQGEWSYGCLESEALVEPGHNVSIASSNPLRSPPLYQLVRCGTNNQCPDGFFCNTRLADSTARCCPSFADTGPKYGDCPEISSINYETEFCVDQCLSDADCLLEEKCCASSKQCPRKTCKWPE